MSRPKNIDKDPIYNEKEARKKARKKWEKNNPEKWERQKINQRFKRRYGITVNQWDEMLIKQNNVCLICKQIPTGLHSSGNPHKLHVDHNHTTGKVRGLLCTQCNRGLGYFKDNAELLIKASEYLNDNN